MWEKNNGRVRINLWASEVAPQFGQLFKLRFGPNFGVNFTLNLTGRRAEPWPMNRRFWNTDEAKVLSDG